MLSRMLFFPAVAHSIGLTPPKEALRGLRRMVVLAGPNGAGKSRYLGLLQRTVNQFRQTRSNRSTYESNIQSWRGTVRNISVALAETAEWREAQTENYTTAIQQHEILLDEARQFEDAIQSDEISRDQPFVVLTYNINLVAEPREQTPNMITNIISANRNPGFAQAHASLAAYFDRVAKDIWSADHPSAKSQPSVIQALDDANSFNDILDALVGGRVEPDYDSTGEVVAKFRRRVFQYSELSKGEAVLITWAIILHRQRASFQDAIVIIDEPENHLHPDACVKALTALRDTILGPRGQIWLATHSVQLIAFAGMESIWMVDNGRIEYAGNKVDKVIDRLLGGRDGRDKLRTFLADADDLGFHKFAAECLTNPHVAAPDAADPQEAQFVRLVRERRARGERLRILDYGAGRGRLATALREAGHAETPNPSELFYHAYNGPQASPNEVVECRGRVQELADGEGARAIYLNDIRSVQLQAEVKMDAVVLCNVLHEIPVGNWLSVFNDIADSLRDGGVLLLMEDQNMPVGELPTAHGFIVLDTIEVSALFGTTPGKGVREIERVHHGRLTQIEVHAGVLRNATSESIKQALGLVVKRARSAVERLRQENQRTFQAGRSHAYFSMLHMNAMLALSAYA
ncbi:MAG: AAA family ATPase [Byssovorax sp.]